MSAIPILDLAACNKKVYKLQRCVRHRNHFSESEFEHLSRFIEASVNDSQA